MIDQPLNQRLREIREGRHAAVEELTPEHPPKLPRRTPLGRLLVEKGLLGEDELDLALERQRENHRPLGQILIDMGAVTQQNLARTLTEQHGFDASGSLRARLGTGEDGETSGVEGEAADDAPESYLVREATDTQPLHVASTLLDAADAAFELIEEHDLERLEIVRARGGELEHVWSYRRAEADTTPPPYPA